MKKIISALLVSVLLIGVILTLASCASIDDGSYVGANGTVVAISGDSYTVKASEGQEEISYTFEIKDNETNPDKQEIHLTVASGASKGEKLVFSYEKLEDGFAVNGVKYTKQ